MSSRWQRFAAINLLVSRMSNSAEATCKDLKFELLLRLLLSSTSSCRCTSKTCFFKTIHIVSFVGWSYAWLFNDRQPGQGIVHNFLSDCIWTIWQQFVGCRVTDKHRQLKFSMNEYIAITEMTVYMFSYPLHCKTGNKVILWQAREGLDSTESSSHCHHS